MEMLLPAGPGGAGRPYVSILQALGQTRDEEHAERVDDCVGRGRVVEEERPVEVLV